MDVGPCRTPVRTMIQDELLSLSESREIPFCFNLKISPLCQTLSIALDMSKETFLSSNLLSKYVKTLWIIDDS